MTTRRVQFTTPAEMKRVQGIWDYVNESPFQEYVVNSKDARFLLRVIKAQEKCINQLLAGYSVRLPRTKKKA